MDAELIPVLPVEPAEPGVPAQPEGFMAALLLGIRRAAQNWPVLLMMLLGTLVSAGLLALIPALNLFNLAHRPAIAEMSAGIRAWQIVDLLGVISGAASNPAGSPVYGELTIALLGFAAMPLVGGFVSAFLYGGVVLTYKEAAVNRRAGFPMRRFLWGCWHWFGGYLGLALIEALLFVVVFVPLSGLAIALSGQGPAVVAVTVVVVLVLAWLWLMVFELARVRLVINETRNPFRGIGLAIGDLFQRPLPLLGFYAAALLLLLVVQAVFRLVVNPNVPLDLLIVAVVVQQGFLLARLFCRALRLAGLVGLLER